MPNNAIKHPLYWVRGMLTLSLLCMNLLFLPLVVLILASTNIICPLPRWKHHTKYLSYVVLPQLWTAINNRILKLTQTQWHIHGNPDFRKDGWYTMVCNHRSWADILVLDCVFAPHLPKLKFFMKQSLIWMLPICGLACRIMGYPFVKRHRLSDIRKNPALKQHSIETIHKLSPDWLQFPSVIVTFLEGTRYTPEKHKKQQSPYQHLLQPSALGLSLVLQGMRPKLNGLIDVTIVYPKPHMNLWHLLSGQAAHIHVHYECIPLHADWFGDYPKNPQFRQHFRKQLQALWQAKDQHFTP